jgi:hypothetical protein
MVTEKIKYRTGTMTKSPFDMDDAENKIWQEKGKIEAREYLFPIGQPLVYFIDNQVVIENNDGTIEYIDR